MANWPATLWRQPRMTTMSPSPAQPAAAGPACGGPRRNAGAWRPHCLAAMLAGATVATAVAGTEALQRYTIVSGDTLIAIAGRMLENPHDWPKLQRHNRIADPYRLRPGSVISIPAEWLRREPAPGRVVAATGRVSAGDRALVAGDPVGTGDQVVTGEQSFVTIELVDGSRLTLQPSSRLKVERMVRLPGTTRAETRLRLEKGRVESSVRKDRDARPRYIVDTPGATVGVRGTTFRVATTGDATLRAEVDAGEVGVTRHGMRAVAVPAGFGILTAPGRLAAPVALLPAPDLSALPALQERPLVRFPLPPLAGARSYRAQVTDRQGRILSEDLATRPEARFAGLADGEYTLRVRGIDGAGLEGTNAELGFRLKARPEPPFATSPIAGRKLRGSTATLSWSHADGAARYRIQLAADAGFASPLADIDGVEGTRIVPLPTLAPGDYVWRARSVRADGDVGPWGDPQPFALRALPADPEPPAIGKDSIDFAWPAEPGQTFLFQLARDEGFADILSEQTLGQPRTTVARPEPGTYFLRVRAIDADGFVGPFTATQKFIVPAPTPWWLMLVLFPVL